MHHRLTVLLLAVGALIALPSVASADSEPNDGIAQFEGPVGGGTDHPGALSTEDDSDWYAFYVAGQQQLHIPVSSTSPEGCSVGAYLKDTDGRELTDTRAYPGKGAEVITYTTAPGVNRYFLKLSDSCTGSTYSFRIDPAGGLTGGPGRPTPLATGEPNETASQAWGPLRGATDYAGAIQTTNDTDVFRFYTAPGSQQLDVALTAVSGCSIDWNVAPERSSTDAPSGEGYTNADTIDHVRLTAPRATAYLVSVTSCEGSGYLLRVDPPGAVSLTPPPSSAPAGPTAQQRCQAARRDVSRKLRRVKSTARQLRKTRSASAKRRLRKQLRVRKRALERARDRRAIVC